MLYCVFTTIRLAPKGRTEERILGKGFPCNLQTFRPLVTNPTLPCSSPALCTAIDLNWWGRLHGGSYFFLLIHFFIIKDIHIKPFNVKMQCIFFFFKSTSTWFANVIAMVGPSFYLTAHTDYKQKQKKQEELIYVQRKLIKQIFKNVQILSEKEVNWFKNQDCFSLWMLTFCVLSLFSSICVYYPPILTNKNLSKYAIIAKQIFSKQISTVPWQGFT